MIAVTDIGGAAAAHAPPDTDNRDKRPVTDNGDGAHGRRAPDTPIRDCWRCGEPLSTEETVYLYGGALERGTHEACAAAMRRDVDRRQWERWVDHHPNEDIPDFVHDPDAPGYDPFRAELWNLRPCEACGRGVRGHGDKPRAVCSFACKDKLPSVARRERRRRARLSEIPDSITCTKCESDISGTVVFWWAEGWPRRLVTWCERCFAADRTDEDRARRARYGDKPNMFGHVYPDPDAAGYNPFGDIHNFDPAPCSHCRRLIRWGIDTSGFCCERCRYEAKKAARRVPLEEKFCLVCGEAFTPKRSDAVTCSDRCRQAKRRMGLVTDSHDARTRPRGTDTPNRDIAG